jgi:hypothetical protein
MLSAVVIGALAAIQALHAQGGAAVAAAPQFEGDYAFTGSADCRYAASATCRRKPRARAPSGYNADFTNGAAPIVEVDVGSVHVQGNPAAVQLDARQSTIIEVLSALSAAFNISYRSSIALDEALNGTYAGSLGHVISRVLDGYNYVVKRDNAKLDVTIFGKRGERAVPVAAPHPAPPLRERPRPGLLGTEHHRTSLPFTVWRYAQLGPF